MKIRKIQIALALAAALISGSALAAPCTVESSSDNLSSSSTLRYIIQEFLNDRSDKPCSATGYEDGEYFDQSVGILTDEANTSSQPDVNEITLTSPIEIDMNHTAVIGNVSQDALDDVETDHAVNVSYETDGNKSNDGDSYTKVGGEVKDYGMLVLDARGLGEDVKPFDCQSGTEKVYLRNMIILTDSVTIDEVFEGCVDDGGNAWVCAYEYKEGSDPRTDSDWCERTWSREVIPFDPDNIFKFPRTWYADRDGDGYGDPNDSIVIQTTDADYDTGRDEYTTRDHTDCDDTNEDVNPAATEICDGIDNNCDAVIDTDAVDKDTWYIDADTDFYGNPLVTLMSCEQPAGYVADNTDCDDSDPALTTDCSPDVPTTWYRDADGDTYGNANDSTVATAQPGGYVANDDDCDDTNATLTTDCSGEDDDAECSDGLDNDGDGLVDCDDDSCAGADSCDVPTIIYYYFWFRDADEDGYGDPAVTTTGDVQPAGYVANAGDCDDANPELTLDCSGETETWYADHDEDGYGNWFDSTTGDQPDGYVENAGDCDDSDAARTTDCRIPVTTTDEGKGPDPATECSDGLDNDADGLTDCADSPCSLFAMCNEVTPDISPTPDDSASPFSGQLEGSVVSGGCSLTTGSGGALNSSGAALLSLLAIFLLLASRQCAKNGKY